jgi:hypothetical protein
MRVRPGFADLDGWAELRVAAVLRAAPSVVELGPVVAAVDDRGWSVVIHHRLDEDQPVVGRSS